MDTPFTRGHHLPFLEWIKNDRRRKNYIVQGSKLIPPLVPDPTSCSFVTEPAFEVSSITLNHHIHKIHFAPLHTLRPTNQPRKFLFFSSFPYDAYDDWQQSCIRIELQTSPEGLFLPLLATTFEPEARVLSAYYSPYKHISDRFYPCTTLYRRLFSSRMR